MAAKGKGRSCYVLELSVGPGGSRWAEVHAYPEARTLQRWLAHFCRNEGGFSAYHAIWYGATLAIWVVEAGEVTRMIDLHPHLRAHLPDGTSLRLDDQAQRDRIGEEREDADADGEGNPFEYFERVTLETDWDAIAKELPELAPPLLHPGERTAVKNPWWDVKRGQRQTPTYVKHDVQYGSFDEEAGDALELPADEG
jgi:hypothetical protein